MKRKKADEYHVTEAEFRKFLYDYPSRYEMEEIYGKYLPPSGLAEQAIKDDDRVEGLPTREQIEKIIMGVKATPPKWPLTYRYIYDETGTQRCVEVSDGHGFVIHMAEDCFLEMRKNREVKNDLF